MSKLDTIKLYEDSEYIRLFGDDDTPEGVMENVYKKELGSSFERVESGVVIGKTEEKELTKDEAFNAIVKGMKIMGWDKKEEEKEERPSPMPPKSPFD